VKSARQRRNKIKETQGASQKSEAPFLFFRSGNEKCGFHNCDDNNYEIYSSDYGSYFSFRIHTPIYDEDGYVKMTTKSRRIYPVFVEEESEIFDDIKEIERNLH
jgi:hypothetical protein